MNRVGLIARVTLGIISAAALSSCGGGGGTLPPPACVNTSTLACTQSGALRGIVAGNLVAFRGIPYSAPPVGNLRWKAPQPPTSWSGVRDASTFGNVCPQINSAGVYAGDEDCLVLNVYVSQTPPNHNQPVMVFFHGGGNVSGDTQYTPTSLDAPPLADQGVVVVTAEYRLGILGFLATSQLTAEGGGSSGAYALLDMIAALTWVKQNIAAFGGDVRGQTHVSGNSGNCHEHQA